MPDKEFDNLFKSKFENAEMEPSVDLWANIEKELAPKKKRTFPIYWMAAATIAIAFTAILVFQQKEEVVLLHGAEETTAQTNPAQTIENGVASGTNEVVTETPIAKTETVNFKGKTGKKRVEQALAPATNQVENNSTKIQVAVQPNQNNPRLPIKLQDPKPIDVLPIKEVVTVESPMVSAAATTKTNTVEPDMITEGTTERKGIRNVGDLVNYVVDKVDKRDKKFVKFNTDDDDNSSIVGINIGFLKFNKKNKDQK